MFDQQQQAIQAQIPAIQNLYQTLSQGLNQDYQTNLASGVKGIVEDASARGVLRSTLPVDARQSLTSQLGAALQSSLGQLSANQAKDISGVSTQLGDLGLKRASSVADLARSLETQDLQRQQLEQQRLQDERDYQLAQQKLALAARQASAPVAPSASQITPLLNQALQQAAGRDGYVSPATYQAAKRDWISQGLSSKEFDTVFAAYRNPYAGDLKNGKARSLADYGVV